jgi:hypothetical protein
MRIVFIIGMMISVIGLGRSSAQDNYRPYVLGLRTAGMGGAATAFGQDSAMAWINPAGLAKAGNNTFAMSANTYMLEQFAVNDYFTASEAFRFEQGLSENFAQASLDSSRISVFPSCISYILQLDTAGDMMLGLSLIVPYQGSQRKHQKSLLNLGSVVWRNEYVETRHSIHYEIGPSLAMRWGIISLGASAFFRYTPIEMEQFSDTSLVSPTIRGVAFGPLMGNARGSSYDLDFVAGAQLGPIAGGLYMGLTLHSPSVHLGGSVSFYENYNYFAGQNVDTGENDFSYTHSTLSDNDLEVRTPFWLSFGLGYEKSGSFALAADVSYYLPYSYVSQSGTQLYTTISSQAIEGNNVNTSSVDFSTETSRQGVINANLGIEFFLSPRIVLRVGGFTDFAARDIVALEERNSYDVGTYSVDRFGGTLGVAYSGDSSQFQLALMYLGGLGDIIAMQLDQIAMTADSGMQYPERDIAFNSYMLVFSGQIDAGLIFNKVKRAIVEEYHHASSAVEKEPVREIVPPKESFSRPEKKTVVDDIRQDSQSSFEELEKEEKKALQEASKEEAPLKKEEVKGNKLLKDEVKFDGWPDSQQNTLQPIKVEQQKESPTNEVPEQAEGQ